MADITTAEVKDFVGERILGAVPQRRADAAKYLDYYQGDQVGYVPKNPDESQSHFDKRPKITVNLTRRIVDAKSCLYDEGAVRQCDDPAVRRFWQEVDIDQRMRELDPVVYLCGTAFVFPDFVTPERTWWKRLKSYWPWAASEDGRYIWRAYAPSQVEVLTDPDYPEIPRLMCTFWGTQEAGDDVTVTNAWSARHWWELRNGEVVASGAHRFGRPPFVKCGGEPDLAGDFWGRPAGPNIVPQNEEINRLLSSSEWLAICQSHGQWVGKNLPADWKPTMGTDQVVVFADADAEHPGELKLVAPVSDLEKLKDYIDWLIDGVCSSNDVPAGTFRLDLNRESGMAISAKSKEIDRVRRRRRPTALAWERELAAMARIVKAGRLSDSREIPTDMPEMSIDYREPYFPKPAQDRVTEETHELATGQTTVPRIMMGRDPDLTREDAEALHAENLAYNKSTAPEPAAEGLPPTPEAFATAEAIAKAAGEGSGPPAPAKPVIGGVQTLYDGRETMERG